MTLQLPDFLVPGGALNGPLFAAFIEQLDGDRPQLTPDARVGPFVIQRELGRGGASVVYLADRVDGGFSQRVAIKVARASEAHRQRFRFERHLLAQLEHPFIARLIDGGELDGGWLWSAMEFVDGVPLDRYCHAEQLEWRKRVQLVRAIAEAIRYAHQRLVIHGDIKCDNILVDRQGQPRLLDFGIAIHLRQAADESSLAFSPGVASPEQQQGLPLTTASDVYQLGRLLESVLQRSEDKAGSVNLPLRVRQNVDAVIRKATQVEAAQRYASIEALLGDLEYVLQHRPVSCGQWHSSARLAFWWQRERRLAVTGFAVISVLALLSGIYVWHVWQAQLNAKREAHAAQVTSQFLSNLFRLTPASSQGTELTVENLLDHAATNGMALFAERETDQAIAAAALARAYLEQKQHRKAAELLDRFINAEALWPQLALELQLDLLLMRIRAAQHLAEQALVADLLQHSAQLLQDNDNASLDFARLRWAKLQAAQLSRQDRTQAAQQLLEDTAAQWRDSAIVDSTEYAELILRMAYAADGNANAKMTLQYAEEAHHRFSRALGAVAPATLDAQRDWVWYCIKYGRLEQASVIMVQQVALTRQFFGAESIEHALALQMQGNVHYAGQDYQAAEAHLRQALTIFLQRQADPYGFVAMTMQNLADALAPQQRWSELLSLREQVVAIRAAVLPANHRLLRLSELRVAEAQCHTGAVATARAWRQQAVAMPAESWHSADGSLEAALAGVDVCLAQHDNL